MGRIAGRLNVCVQFADSYFDVVLDKGSLDSLMGDATDGSLAARSYLSEVCSSVRFFSAIHLYSSGFLKAVLGVVLCLICSTLHLTLKLCFTTGERLL